jgi:predicted nucleic acid-binding protein
MRFWDSSAIIPLCLKETASEAIKALMKDDEYVVVWWTTRVECLSALSRRRREGVLSPGDEAKARTVLTAGETAKESLPEGLRRRVLCAIRIGLKKMKPVRVEGKINLLSHIESLP